MLSDRDKRGRAFLHDASQTMPLTWFRDPSRVGENGVILFDHFKRLAWING